MIMWVRARFWPAHLVVGAAIVVLRAHEEDTHHDQQETRTRTPTNGCKLAKWMDGWMSAQWMDDGANDAAWSTLLTHTDMGSSEIKRKTDAPTHSTHKFLRAANMLATLNGPALPSYAQLLILFLSIQRLAILSTFAMRHSITHSQVHKSVALKLIFDFKWIHFNIKFKCITPSVFLGFQKSLLKAMYSSLIAKPGVSVKCKERRDAFHDDQVAWAFLDHGDLWAVLIHSLTEISAREAF